MPHYSMRVGVDKRLMRPRVFHVWRYADAVKNLIRGRTLKLTERHKSDVEWQNKVWEGIKAVCHNPEISKMIEASNNVGSDKLFSRFASSLYR